MVPVPWNWACVEEETTSQLYPDDLKSILPALNENSVCPVGTVEEPLGYFTLNPKLALPVAVGFAGSAPGGESIHPPPVTNPPFGSYTTTYLNWVLAVAASLLFTVNVT